MPIIRYMTPEEEKFWPHANGFVTPDGQTIAYKKGVSEEYLPHLLRHEIGHTKYPVDVDMRMSDSLSSFQRRWLLSELLASYFCLKVDPKDKEAKFRIVDECNYARQAGVPKSEVKVIMQQAKRTVEESK